MSANRRRSGSPIPLGQSSLSSLSVGRRHRLSLFTAPPRATIKIDPGHDTNAVRTRHAEYIRILFVHKVRGRGGRRARRCKVARARAPAFNPLALYVGPPTTDTISYRMCVWLDNPGYHHSSSTTITAPKYTSLNILLHLPTATPPNHHPTIFFTLL